MIYHYKIKDLVNISVDVGDRVVYVRPLRERIQKRFEFIVQFQICVYDPIERNGNVDSLLVEPTITILFQPKTPCV